MLSTSLAAGESVVAVAEWLGHDNATLVLSTYGHLMAGSEDRMRKAIDGAYTDSVPSVCPSDQQQRRDQPKLPHVRSP